MKTYNCMVNLGGPILHLVPRAAISAAEVDLLLFLHGNDSVRNLEVVADVPVAHGPLYDYLMSRYGEVNVEKRFGKKTRKLSLPEEIDLDAMFADPDALDGEADMLEDPTKAAMEAVAINQENAAPAQRKTLTLNKEAFTGGQSAA